MLLFWREDVRTYEERKMGERAGWPALWYIFELTVMFDDCFFFFLCSSMMAWHDWWVGLMHPSFGYLPGHFDGRLYLGFWR
jgi:hypothetical protein